MSSLSAAPSLEVSPHESYELSHETRHLLAGGFVSLSGGATLTGVGALFLVAAAQTQSGFFDFGPLYQLIGGSALALGVVGIGFGIGLLIGASHHLELDRGEAPAELTLRNRERDLEQQRQGRVTQAPVLMHTLATF